MIDTLFLHWASMTTEIKHAAWSCRNITTFARDNYPQLSDRYPIRVVLDHIDQIAKKLRGLHREHMKDIRSACCPVDVILDFYLQEGDNTNDPHEGTIDLSIIQSFNFVVICYTDS